MKKNSYTGKNIEELQKVIREKRESLQAFRFGTSGSKTRNVKEGKMLRKDIARAETEITRIRLAA
jgi:ribosomal protein L29